MEDEDKGADNESVNPENGVDVRGRRTDREAANGS